MPVNNNSNNNIDTSARAELAPGEKDYLVVDPSVPGQDWCVLSFITPKDLTRKRELFMIDHFLKDSVNDYLVSSAQHMSRDINARFFKQMEERIEKLGKSKVENHELIARELTQLRKELEVNEDEFAEKSLHSHKLNEDEFEAKYEDFKIRRGEHLEREFNEKQGGGRPSLMGVKFSGAYPYQEAATDRAKFLAENVERGVHHFVGQSFHWLPFDPNPDAVADNRYQNKELNKLMQQKSENAELKDKFFQERKEELVKSAQEDNQGRKDKLRDDMRKKYKNQKKKK